MRSYSIPMPPNVSDVMVGHLHVWWVSMGSDALAVPVVSNKHVVQENARKQCYHLIFTIPLANHSLTKK